MAFHASNFGSFGAELPRDMNGYVPQEGDGPFALAWDHGTERTHAPDGTLTDYGRWWAEEGYPDLLARAAEATASANEALAAWRQESA